METEFPLREWYELAKVQAGTEVRSNPAERSNARGGKVKHGAARS